MLVLRLLKLSEVGRAILWALFIGMAIAALIGWACSRLPVGLGSENLMAEMALQFVFGRSVGRAVLPPMPRAESWPMIVRETWVAGLLVPAPQRRRRRGDGRGGPDAVTLRDLLP